MHKSSQAKSQLLRKVLGSKTTPIRPRFRDTLAINLSYLSNVLEGVDLGMPGPAPELLPYKTGITILTKPKPTYIAIRRHRCGCKPNVRSPIVEEI